MTERFLEQETAESRGQRAATLAAVLAEFRTGRLRLATPLRRGNDLAGWVELAEGLPERYLTAEIAAALMAVGHQAADALDRIAAQADARRREKLAAVGELSAGLAHEVRNPVAAIRGAAQAIGPQATPEQRDEMLEVLQEETARLERVVGEFLDYARPAAPRREPVDVVEIVRRVLQGARLAGRGLETGLDAPVGLPHALADPDQLQRVVENLVRNAWEATGAGGRLDVTVRAEPAGRVTLEFADDGPGLAPETLERIFTPFYTTKAGGTGLGLALAHRVVDAHGGRLRAASAPGGGARFTLELPTAVEGR